MSTATLIGAWALVLTTIFSISWLVARAVGAFRSRASQTHIVKPVRRHRRAF